MPIPKIQIITLGCFITLSGLMTLNAQSPGSVLYSDNPSSHPIVADTLSELFGSSDPNSGNFNETDLGFFSVSGTGEVEVEFQLISEAGGYDFEFGYFEVSDELIDGTYDLDTAIGKESWATAALSSAQVIFSEHGGNMSSHTATITAGTSIGFFIIPDNTLANFQYNPDSFSLTDNYEDAWPLFTHDAANPGSDSETSWQKDYKGDWHKTTTYTGAGEGYDQSFSFYGTTTDDSVTNGATGTLVTWEDVSRNPYAGGNSDNDFDDLQFFISNTRPTAVPEASTVFTALLFLTSLIFIERKRILKVFNLK